MKRFFDNLIVDLLAGGLMLGLAVTGYVLRFPLPPGTNKTSMLWGLTRHQWGGIHFWISLGVLALVAIHVVLHWQWIVVSVKRRLGRSASPGSGAVSGAAASLALLALLLLFGWAAQSGVRHVPESTSDGCLPGDAIAAPVSPGLAARAVFEEACVACHGPRKQLGGFRVDRPDDLFGRGGSTAWITPGDSARSPLLDLLEGRGDAPPRAAHQLSEARLAALRAWIDAGAPWPDAN